MKNSCAPVLFCQTLGFFALLVLAAMPATVLAASAYVPNEKSGTVSVIDTETDKVVAEIQVGKLPRGIAVARDGARLYVSTQPKFLSVVDIAKRAVIANIVTGESPEAAYLSSDGRWVAVADEESNDVSVVDTTTLTKAFTVKTKGKNPEHAAFTPDGRFIYVGAEDDEIIEIIDVAARKVVRTFTTGTEPDGMAWAD